MKRLPLSVILASVTLAWITGTAYWAYVNWPLLPVDVSAGERLVRATYENEIHTHISATGLALAPALSLLVLAALLHKPNGSSD